MSARCKPGDLAMITHDVPSCAENIGRIVKVSGPPDINSDGCLTWIIEPVTLEPYMINDRFGNFVGFMDFEEGGIEHRDAWMVPIAPGAEDESSEVTEPLNLDEVLQTE